MEKPIPMDRLICGDVGYGKTEVAVRAAFKAVQDGKQVAVLVPTTLLAQQHISDVHRAVRRFPVIILRALAVPDRQGGARDDRGPRGRLVDIVIGTHRLLQTVRFKDLGLVIIDEEQRFGVEHKEHLKKLKTERRRADDVGDPDPAHARDGGHRHPRDVDDPTPPEERHPILTFVGPYDDKQVGAAIRRELLREGQVFYVHNRVESDQPDRANCARLVPEARIAVAHGQMDEHVLEQVMVDFWERKFDVLVCDDDHRDRVSTSPTQHADRRPRRQVRAVAAAPAARPGRPGRERAYAYFLYPPREAAVRDRATTGWRRSRRTTTSGRASRSR
jgi:transcription-repair coupling factor (superfamily II helicase)